MRAVQVRNAQVGGSIPLGSTTLSRYSRGTSALFASTYQFDGKPSGTRRAPEFNEHGDEILSELGLDMEKILELRIQGAVT